MNSKLSESDISYIIELAWGDRISFEDIRLQFNLQEKEVIKLMRQNLKPSSFRMWRKRVTSSVSKKHFMKKNSKYD
jgi:uncharacterized protein (TIGR03643 family)